MELSIDQQQEQKNKLLFDSFPLKKRRIAYVHRETGKKYKGYISNFNDGSIRVNWDNGARTELNTGDDSMLLFRVVKK